MLQGEFVDGGTETHFTIEDAPAYIRVTSSSDRKTGLVYDLIYKDKMVSQEKEVYQWFIFNCSYVLSPWFKVLIVTSVI